MRTFFKDVFGWGGLVAFLIVLASQSEPAHAYDNRDLHRLLTTNSCQNCDLRGLSLKRVRLRDADLDGAMILRSNLRHVNMQHASRQDAFIMPKGGWWHAFW